MSDWEFEEGRCVVPLSDGTSLSIICEERSKVLREARRNNPLATWSTHVAASTGTYEVAIIDTVTEAAATLTEHPWELAPYYDEDLTDSYICFGYVPKEAILNYIGRIGEADGEDKAD